MLEAYNGNFHVKVATEDQNNTAFTSSHGLLRFTLILFGLKNAPGRFPQTMDVTLKKLVQQFALVHLDDIFILLISCANRSITFDKFWCYYTTLKLCWPWRNATFLQFTLTVSVMSIVLGASKFWQTQLKPYTRSTILLLQSQPDHFHDCAMHFTAFYGISSVLPPHQVGNYVIFSQRPLTYCRRWNSLFRSGES